MHYTDRDDIEANLPPSFLVQALDDDGDGIEDAGAWAKVSAAVDADIDGYLSRRYPLPLPTIPRILRAFATSLALEKLYNRRGMTGDKNPYTTAANTARDHLAAIANGAENLAVGTGPARPSISVISERSGTKPRSRLNG